MNNPIIEEGFLEIQNASSSLGLSLVADIESILSGHGLVTRKAKPYLQAARLPTSSPLYPDSTSQSSPSDHDPNPLPEFIEHAYQYFVANIHNPYPTREEKQAIVDKSSNSCVTLTSVSNWFTNARRRCGWAEILKHRCGGNREEMVDLAKRIFIKEDPDRPVDPQVVADFMEMKENVETMYEKKTRTSAWIEDLGNLDQLLSTISSKRHENGLKDRRQGKKMQTRILGKTGKVVGQMQRHQGSESTASRIVSVAGSSTSEEINEDEEVASGSVPMAHTKRKNFHDGFFNSRGISPSSSISSFSFSSTSSDGRVPSLTWSDSGDEERPYKRSRFGGNTSSLSSPVTPDLLFPLEEPSSPILPLITPIRGQKRSYDVEFDADATPKAKRVRSDTTQMMQDNNLVSPTPTYHISGPPADLTSFPVSTAPSRRRSSFAHIDLDSLLTLGAQEPQPVEITPPDTSVPLEVGVFDWSSPLDSFDFSGTLGMNMDVNGGSPPADFTQLFQFVSHDGIESEKAASELIAPVSRQDQTDVGAGIDVSQSASELLTAPPHIAFGQSPPSSIPEAPLPDLQVDLSSFDLTSLWPQNHPQISLTETRDLIPAEGHIYDLSGLMSGLSSTHLLDNFGFDCSVEIPTSSSQVATPLLDISLDSSPRSRSVTPTWASTSIPPTPAAQDAMSLPGATHSTTSGSNARNLTIDLSGQDLEMVEKALKKEYKRRELEEKKAALERERARLEELERELEDD